MFANIFSAVIYIPLVIICVIITQIYFEQFLFSHFINQLKKTGVNLIIVITYLLQELCILQISLMNIHDVAFPLTVPATMVLRQRNRKTWWILLALTPLYTASIQYFAQHIDIAEWSLWIVKTILILLILWLLLRQKNLNQNIRYFLAIMGAEIVHLISFNDNGHITLLHIITITFGSLFIIFFEEQRFAFEQRNHRRLRRLQVESERDDLTGLLNYRVLTHEIEKLTKEESVHNVVIGALDIDHFKRINDTYGHFDGNIVLSNFSQVLKEKIHKAFPRRGYVYRFGGEEFSIVVTNYSVKEVYNQLQEIENYFNTSPILTSDGSKVTISFSCSLVSHLESETLDQTFKRADSALYDVKNHGRGWIITDEIMKQ